MAGYVFGAGFLAFVAWQLWADRPPAGAVRVRGVVVEELSRRSGRPGSRKLVHAPRVSFVHPRTGESQVLEPTAWTGGRYRVGGPLDLRYDPSTDSVRLPLQEKTRMVVVLGLVGVGLVLAEALA